MITTPTTPKKALSVTAPRGFIAAGATAGIKASGKSDLAIIAAESPCRAAAVFTTNTIPSEPVRVGREHVANGKLRAIVCNSGNANASTGARGMRDARAMCQALADELNCPSDQILACSTGVIGEHLPMDKIIPGIQSLAPKLKASTAADRAAARAIMTTDLAPKHALQTFKIGAKTVTLGGIAKGSGMIAPNMATMLAFITTDADISLPLLRAALTQAVNAPASFNRLTVDTDTSPSDTVTVMASALAGHAPIKTKTSAAYRAFVKALTALSQDLAYQIIADGEGVQHVIRVVVNNAKTNDDAIAIGRAVADSPLVKTAVHGGDPNWGRLTMAVGKAGAAVDPAKLTIKIGDATVYRNGQPAKTDTKKLEKLMRAKEVTFTIDLKLGKASTEILGCDLSREYITINADYHT